MARDYFCFYHSYKENIETLTDEEVGRLVKACLQFSETGTFDPLPGAEKHVFPGIKAQIKRDITAYEEKCKAAASNGAKGGRPKNQKNQTVFPETGKSQGEGEGKGEGKGEGEGERKRGSSAPAEAAKKPFGQYGWVKLDSGEYNRLLNDLGEAEVNRCIRYIDESAQSSGNKNQWRDWNLVIRRCSRERWGIRSESPPPQRPSRGPCNPFLADLEGMQ